MKILKFILPVCVSVGLLVSAGNAWASLSPSMGTHVTAASLGQYRFALVTDPRGMCDRGGTADSVCNTWERNIGGRD